MSPFYSTSLCYLPEVLVISLFFSEILLCKVLGRVTALVRFVVTFPLLDWNLFHTYLTQFIYECSKQ